MTERPDARAAVAQAAPRLGGGFHVRQPSPTARDVSPPRTTASVAREAARHALHQPRDKVT